ncbi:energy transducer TonB [Zobellia uliginosa]|uniref:energy transducer TonB n=1 Tax=Zobellia uliginosa TaxID=143224 RepID=UPI0026E1A4BD|nr:energy transducer TonB [Zobellia uliginosa]MDO6519108.1 energy transducer TonB [Zobellia uliginosa]
MKPKKNPQKDLNGKRPIYFLFGLLFALMLTLAAFEWKTYDRTYDYDTSMNIEDELTEELPILVEFKTPPPPKQIQAPPIIEIIDDDEEDIEDVIESTETDQEEKILEVSDIEVMETDEPEKFSFMVIEDVPVFPGCEKEKDKRACFQTMMNKHIAKNFRYPESAQEMGIQGKVNIMFVIQKDGSIDNIQLRGPDKSLEKEAKRIIDKLPRMEPGKQRGTPVRVPFSIPIVFKLQ